MVEFVKMELLTDCIEMLGSYGSISIFLIVAIVVLGVMWMIGYGVYYFIFGELEPRPKRGLWISIVDYQDKLSEEQKELYLEYSWHQFEKQIEHERALALEAESGTYNDGSIVVPRCKTTWERMKRAFFGRGKTRCQNFYDCRHCIRDLSELQDKDDWNYFSE